jgi:hypothetical protein
MKYKLICCEVFMRIACMEIAHSPNTIDPEFTNLGAHENPDRLRESIDGTAKRAFKDFPFEVAGKTGTAETGYESNQSSNALFVCYAPADDPKIAVAVVVEKGVWGSYTAPIARDIMEAYFGLNDTNRADDSIKFDEGTFYR